VNKETLEAQRIEGMAESMVDEAVYGFLGMISDGKPYAIPISFARQGQTIYFHGGRGRKSEALRSHPHACLTMVDTPRLIQGDTGCNVSFAYRSVLVSGPVRRVQDSEEKGRALTALVAKYHAEQAAAGLAAGTVERTLVWALEVDQVSLCVKRED